MFFQKNNHFAGTDQQRLEDFQSALDNPTVKAIWCARGGYGTVRIIDKLDFTAFKKSPKWIIGYSDITVLHNHIHNLGYETIHGMMPVNMEFSESSREKSVSTLKNTLFGSETSYSISSTKYNKTGNTSGILIGGNLTILEKFIRHRIKY
jgi:muramoyltetrapeptide carboxypeptidase